MKVKKNSAITERSSLLRQGDTMVLDDVYFVIFFTSYYLMLPIITLATVEVNPFSADDSGHGWWHAYANAIKRKGDPRRYPFAVPAWVYVLIHMIVMVFMVIPTYTIFHNAGANDGWSSRAVPLVFAMGTHLLYSFWLTVHIATRGNSNILFAQMLTIGSSFIATVAMVSDTDLGWFSLPYLIWQIVFTVKIAIEHNYTGEKST